MAAIAQHNSIRLEAIAITLSLSLSVGGYTYAQQMNNPGHLKTVGAFGGQGAVASVSAAEVQDANCCIT